MPTERLCDFVRRIRKVKRLTLADVSDRSARLGKRISAGYLSRIENDLSGTVTCDRLAALARGLGVPVEDLLACAMGITRPEPSPEARYFVARFSELSLERQADVLKIIDALH